MTFVAVIVVVVEVEFAGCDSVDGLIAWWQ